jgi:hypothetical protein
MDDPFSLKNFEPIHMRVIFPSRWVYVISQTIVQGTRAFAFLSYGPELRSFALLVMLFSELDNPKEISTDASHEEALIERPEPRNAQTSPFDRSKRRQILATRDEIWNRQRLAEGIKLCSPPA